MSEEASKRKSPIVEIALPETDVSFVLPDFHDVWTYIGEYETMWGWAAKKIDMRPQALADIAQQISNFILEVREQLDETNIRNHGKAQVGAQLRKIFGNHVNDGWIRKAQPWCEFVLATKERSEQHALVQLHYFVKGAIGVSRLDGGMFEAQLHAIIFNKKLAELEPAARVALTKAVKEHEGRLSELREQKALQESEWKEQKALQESEWKQQRVLQESEWKEQLETIKTTLKDHSGNLQSLHDTREKILDDYISESTATIEAWKKAHREEINLKEPVTFWSRRQKSSLIASVILAFAFCVGLVGAGYVLMRESQTIYEGLKVGDPIEYWRVAAMLLLGGLVFWFLRILSKIFLSQLHAWSDAQERVVMVQTYLSLLQDEKGLAVEDRRLVLEALFRPAPSGIIKDDGVPPAVFEMISKLRN